MRHLLLIALLLIITGGLVHNRINTTANNSKNYKTIIFDFDGTLVESIDLQFKCYNELANKYGYIEATPEVIDIIKKNGINAGLKKMNIGLKTWMSLPYIAMKTQKRFRKEIPNIELVDGMLEVLQILKMNGYTLGIITSNNTKNIELFLSNNNLTDIFDFYLCVDGLLNTAYRFFFGKSSTMKKCLKKFKLNPEEVLYIGDEVSDIEAAKQNSIPIISVNWGMATKDLLQKNKPNYFVENPTAILPCIGINLPIFSSLKRPKTVNL